jgi:ribosome-binding factor A
LEVNDPRIGMVSITGVEVSNDFGFAKVYVTVINTLTDDLELNSSTLSKPGLLDKLEIEENIKALTKAAGFLRTKLSKRLETRTVPKLQFLHDRSIIQGQQLSDLIDQAITSDSKHDTSA